MTSEDIKHQLIILKHREQIVDLISTRGKEKRYDHCDLFINITDSKFEKTVYRI